MRWISGSARIRRFVGVGWTDAFRRSICRPYCHHTDRQLRKTDAWKWFLLIILHWQSFLYESDTCINCRCGTFNGNKWFLTREPSRRNTIPRSYPILIVIRIEWESRQIQFEMSHSSARSIKQIISKSWEMCEYFIYSADNNIRLDQFRCYLVSIHIESGRGCFMASTSKRAGPHSYWTGVITREWIKDHVNASVWHCLLLIIHIQGTINIQSPRW